MTDHIEPSHIDTPIRNIARPGITKRPADSYQEIVKKTVEEKSDKKESKDNKDKEQKDQKRETDRYEREFGDNLPENDIKMEDKKKNNNTEGPGIVIDVTI